MSLAQFLSLLETQKLWFNCITEFEDRFEGSTTQQTNRRAERVTQATRAGADVPPEITRDYIQRRAEELRRGVFVSCWYASHVESAALWQWVGRYGTSVAILSSFQVLDRALKHDAYIAAVKYLDYKKMAIPEGSQLNPFFCKRTFFRHEREVRLLVDRTDPTAERPSKGIGVAVDLDSLIGTVVMAPGTERWVRETVAATIRRHGLRARLRPSAMDADPVF